MRKVIVNLSIAVLLLFSGQLSPVSASDMPLKSLAAHAIESGMPTEGEVALVKLWLDAIAPDRGTSAQPWLSNWVGTSLPFSFRYDGRDFAADAKAWQFHRSDPQRKSDVETQDWSWLHAKTGLKVTWHIKRFVDYPAVDTLLTFENTGKSDTAMIEQIKNLDLKLNQSQPGKAYMIHGAHGGRCELDDFMPFSHQIVGLKSVQFGSQPLSSNNELPFFNIETPDGQGIVVGLGWTGNWLAQFKEANAQLNAQAGIPTTKFRLHCGERVRGPRVLLVFWSGRRLHGSNMLRRVLYDHYLPRLPNGKPHEPLVSVNTCFTYHGGGGYLEAVTEQSLLALVRPFIELGAEAYVVDAGYYNCKAWSDVSGTKDYSYSKTKFPRGFRSISEPLGKAGVAFGLWFMPEVFGDMADPQVREQFLTVVDGYVTNQGMTMYRQDGGHTPGGTAPDRLGIPEAFLHADQRPPDHVQQRRRPVDRRFRITPAFPLFDHFGPASGLTRPRLP